MPLEAPQRLQNQRLKTPTQPTLNINLLTSDTLSPFEQVMKTKNEGRAAALPPI